MAYLLRPFAPYILGALVLVSVVFYIRADAQQDLKDQQTRDNLEALERINDAISNPLTPDDFRERLCAHASERTRDLCRN